MGGQPRGKRRDGSLCVDCSPLCSSYTPASSNAHYTTTECQAGGSTLATDRVCTPCGPEHCFREGSLQHPNEASSYLNWQPECEAKCRGTYGYSTCDANGCVCDKM